MFDVREFRKKDLLPLSRQRSNQYLNGWMENGKAAALENDENAFTMLIHGEVVACGGVAIHWKNRGFLWVVFSEDSKHNFVPLFRGMTKFLDTFDCNRIEIAVPVGLKVGHRRATLLGFELETFVAKRFLSDGTDCSIYVRLKPEKRAN